MQSAFQRLSTGGWVANFVIALVFLLIGPILARYLQRPRIAIASAALGLTILIWVVAWSWMRTVPEEQQATRFLVRTHGMMIFQYPGLLVYRYAAKSGPFLAPVGVALVLEVTNNGALASKLFSYAIDIGFGDNWVRLPNLQALNPRDFFWINNGNLRTASRLDFGENSFDVLARNHAILPGDSVRGWVFLEWPRDLRAQVPKIERLRVSLESAGGERQRSIVEAPRADEPGASMLSGGEWHVVPQKAPTDLSNTPILPNVDLLSGVQDLRVK